MLKRVKGETEICRFDSVDVSAVYVGGLTELKDVTDKVNWRIEKCDGLGMDLELVTLDELVGQLASEVEIDGKKTLVGMITVISHSPLSGVIYQWGNYPGEGWFQIGETAGYA